MGNKMRRLPGCFWNIILNFHISRGSVAIYLGWGGSLYNSYTENCPMNTTAKEFWKLVFICQSYDQKSRGCFLLKHLVYDLWISAYGTYVHKLLSKWQIAAFRKYKHSTNRAILLVTEVFRHAHNFHLVAAAGLFIWSNVWALFSTVELQVKQL